MRERGTVFKLDLPVNEIFSRMREVSKKYLEILDPNTFYLTVSALFEPNLGHCFKLVQYICVGITNLQVADFFGQVTVGRLAFEISYFLTAVLRNPNLVANVSVSIK